MLKFTGKGVCGTVAIGNAFLFRKQESVARYSVVGDTDKELVRLERAREKALKQLSVLYEKAIKEAGKKQAEIFEVHQLMLEDENYRGSIESIIRRQSANAEYAVSVTADHYAAMFSDMGDANMQARAEDIRDVSARLIRCLEEGGCTGSGMSDQITNQITNQMTERMVICAEDLAPSDTISLDREKVLAFVTAAGSANSHTAILAKSMNIPAVIGVGAEFLNNIKTGDRIIVDAKAGEIYIDPDDETLERMMLKQELARSGAQEKKRLLDSLKGKENVTQDGTKIDIFANIGGAEDLDDVMENDAGGIGLFRSEFLYMEREDYPTEEQQFAVYKKVLERMNGKKVIIRTLDIGADKQIGYFHMEKEENPALGLRAVRLCLTRPEIFRVQLRALYRASVYGNLGIMFPMITSVSEVERILSICEEVKAELKREQISYSENVETGIMIETPAAALVSDRLAPMVDFFSVGTNDLTQYTLACDRQNANLGAFFDPHHEAVLRLIRMTADNAHKCGIRIGICGELAADTSLTETFLRMGIDELSVSASMVLPLRDRVRKTDLGRK